MSSSKAHILSKYPVPRGIKKGMPVVAFGLNGVITGYIESYICVRFAGQKHSSRVHPLEIAYNGESQEKVELRTKQMNERIRRFNQALNRG